MGEEGGDELIGIDVLVPGELPADVAPEFGDEAEADTGRVGPEDSARLVRSLDRGAVMTLSERFSAEASPLT